MATVQSTVFTKEFPLKRYCLKQFTKLTEFAYYDNGKTITRFFILVIAFQTQKQTPQITKREIILTNEQVVTIANA